MRKVKVSLKKYKDMSIESFVMRELNGKDEEQASKITEAKGEDKHMNELVRMSLVEVDGEPVNVDGVPFNGLDTWSSRTRQMVSIAFQKLNTVANEDIKDFLDSMEEVK